MSEIPEPWRNPAGVQSPGLGAGHPVVLALAAGLVMWAGTGCADEDQTRTLEPIQVGMTASVPPTYSDGEITLYEVKRPVPFPIVAPTASEQAALNAEPVAPYPSKPWVLNEEVKVQITWTLSNLDPDPHKVEILIDPWFEFGRYWPGLALIDAQDQEFLPNLSGIDILYEVPGTKSGSASRMRGTFTFQDMDELATDFATVMNIIANAPPPNPNDPNSGLGSTTLVNHVWERQNRSYNDPLIEQYIPGVIPALTGVDIGLRSHSAGNLALEVVVEVLDKGSDKVLTRDSSDPAIPEPTQFITVGYGAAP